MKYIYWTVFFSIFSFCTWLNAQEINPNYDADLAQQYGSDDYGMKSYVMVILATPEEPVEMSPETMRGHLDNIGSLVESGELLVAGPFGQNEQKYRGLFIFDVRTVEEAQKLVATDPAVAAGIFDVIYIPWYGSAALKAYLEDADKIWKVNP